MENSLNNQDATKQCNKCLKEKPLSEFHKDKQHSTGRRGQCKSCIGGSRSMGQKKSYNTNIVPSIRITKDCPCQDCEYEKPCRILGLTCPSYISWQKCNSFKNQPRIPDKYLDGTTPPPSVL